MVLTVLVQMVDMLFLLDIDHLTCSDILRNYFLRFHRQNRLSMTYHFGTQSNLDKVTSLHRCNWFRFVQHPNRRILIRIIVLYLWNVFSIFEPIQGIRGALIAMMFQQTRTCRKTMLATGYCWLLVVAACCSNFLPKPIQKYRFGCLGAQLDPGLENVTET